MFGQFLRTAVSTKSHIEITAYLDYVSSDEENFQEQGQQLGLRIDESNPQNFPRFENENEGNNFENSCGFS